MVDGRSTQWFGEEVDLLARLVNVDSGSEDMAGVRRVADILSAELSSLGFDVQWLAENRFAPTVYATWGPSSRAVMLMGHMDTVFPAGTAARRPFAMDASTQTARGPGVLDMKGGLALLVCALRMVCENGIRASEVGLRVFLNGDEEPGSPESRAHLPAVVGGAQCVFLLEPPDTEGKLVLSRRGVGVFHFAAAGRSAHAAEGMGANAIHALIQALGDTIRLQDSERGTSVSVGVLGGGTGPSVVPDAAEAVVDVRVASRGEQERIERALARIVHATYTAGTSVSVAGRFHRPPMEPVSGTERFRDLITSVARSLGTELAFEAEPRGGASDGNLLTSLGVPCIDGMGPAGGGAHTNDEWVDLTSLRVRTLLLAEVLRRIVKGEAASKGGSDGLG
ncbi:MAG: M20 family metallopeptidase [Thermotogota bacterium]